MILTDTRCYCYSPLKRSTSVNHFPFLIMFEYEVTLSKGGRHIHITVFAESTQRAYKQAERLYPGTRALNAHQV